jgi:hypothetical protein
VTDENPFPSELTARDQWCLWRIEPDRKGRPTKAPYRPDGRKAASNGPATWSSFRKVCSVLRRQPGFYAGVGFFFRAGDPLCGVDLPRRGATAVNPRSRVRKRQRGRFITMRYPLVFPESLSVVFIAFHKSVVFTHDGGYL